MVGARISEKLLVPQRATASAHVPTTAGTVMGRYPSPGMRSISFSLHQSIVNACGDQPRPLREYTLPSLAG